MANSKKWIWHLVIGIVCNCWIAWAKNQPSQSAEGLNPSIACDQPKFDVGTIPQGEPIKHVFTVKNKGKGLLKIQRVSGG